MVTRRIAVWVRCPECKLQSGFELVMTPARSEHFFECHDCGHEWKAVTMPGLNPRVAQAASLTSRHSDS